MYNDEDIFKLLEQQQSEQPDFKYSAPPLESGLLGDTGQNFQEPQVQMPQFENTQNQDTQSLVQGGGQAAQAMADSAAASQQAAQSAQQAVQARLAQGQQAANQMQAQQAKESQQGAQMFLKLLKFFI